MTSRIAADVDHRHWHPPAGPWDAIGSTALTRAGCARCRPAAGCPRAAGDGHALLAGYGDEPSGHWLEGNSATANPVTAMTQRSGLTSRTFARRFQTATGRRPIDYVHALRIEVARERLETGDEAVDDIGFAVGYADPTFFRRLFKRVTGLTPAAYRRKYAPIVGGFAGEGPPPATG